MPLPVGPQLCNITLPEGPQKCINNYLQALNDVPVVAGHRGDGFTFVQFGIDPHFGFVHHVVGFLKHLINLTIQVHRDGNSSILCCQHKSSSIIFTWKPVQAF